MKDSSYYVYITPKMRPVREELQELLQYKDLIRMLVIREFVVKYKQTILGPLWLILRPFITSMAYLFIFSGIAHIQTDGIPGLLFYTGSNAIWNFFASSLNSNADTFRSNAALFGKVYFPRLCVSVANILIAGIQFGIEMVLFIGLYTWFGLHGEVQGSLLSFVVIPMILLHLGLLGLSCGIIMSSLTTKYRDLGILVSFGVQLWMYATPVVYALSNLSGSLVRKAVLLNPVTQPMELFRAVVFGRGTIVIWSIMLSWVVTILLLWCGIRLFSKVEKTFIDTV